MANILLLDDDEVLTSDLGEYLSRCGGFEVFVCNRLADAKQVVASEAINLAVVDFELKPDQVTGFQAIEVLLGDSADTIELPIEFFLLTGRAEDVRLVLQGEKPPFFPYPDPPPKRVAELLKEERVLSKPVSLSSLRQVIQECLGL